MMRAAAITALLLSGCATFHEGRLPGAPNDAQFATVGGAPVHLVDRGRGNERVVVLLHGFGASLEEWRFMMPKLEAAGHRVIALDLLGFGWSGRPARGDYSVAGQAALVLSVLDGLGINTFSVIGHSWGSAIALHLAVSAKQRVERIVLFNGMVYDDQQPTLFDWSRVPGLGEVIFGMYYRERTDEKMSLAFHDPERFVTEDVLERIESEHDRPGTTAAALATIRGIDLEAQQAAYGRIEQPALLLWGREDLVTPLAVGERLSKELPNVQLTVIPECGHVPMVEAAHRSVRETISFLGGDS